VATIKVAIAYLHTAIYDRLQAQIQQGVAAGSAQRFFRLTLALPAAIGKRKSRYVMSTGAGQ